MIELVCWNARGLNSLLRQKEVKDYIRDKNIGLIGLVEI